MRDQFVLHIGRLIAFISLTGRWDYFPVNFEIKHIKNGFIIDSGIGHIFCFVSTVKH
jgi:hypothetical protein